MGDDLQYFVSSLPKQLAGSVRNWCADNAHGTTTSFANTTSRLDQGQGTAGCPTKGPDCTPPPEVEQTAGEATFDVGDGNVGHFASSLSSSPGNGQNSI